jgi:hypothetical protein
MALGTSLLLIAVGAILRFAVHVSARGFNLHTIGLILIVAGAVGIVLSLLFMTMAGRRHPGPGYGDPDGPVPPGI